MSTEKINGITERLVSRADDELYKLVENAAVPLDNMLAGFRHLRFKTQDTSHKDIEVYAGDTFAAMKRFIVEQKQEQFRGQALDAFLSKFSELESQLDELRARVQP